MIRYALTPMGGTLSLLLIGAAMDVLVASAEGSAF